MRKNLLCFILFLSLGSISYAQVRLQDSLALVDLYNATNGPGWRKQDNWLTGPVSTWYGITVQSYVVTEVDLAVLDNIPTGIKGHIPASISNLTAMKGFALESDSLYSLPDSFSPAMALERIYLLGKVNKGLKSLPPSFFSLIHLTRLQIEKHDLPNIPNAVTQLVNLDMLDFTANLVTTIPDDLSALTKLTTLSLEHNQLTSIPKGVFTAPLLYILNIGYNNILYIPSTISTLTQLGYLTASNCHMNNADSLSFVTCSLEYVDLSYNELDRMPGLKTNCTSLNTLNVSNNKIGLNELEKNAGVGTYIISPQDFSVWSRTTTVNYEPGNAYRLSSGIHTSGYAFDWYNNNNPISAQTDSFYVYTNSSGSEDLVTVNISKPTLPGIFYTNTFQMVPVIAAADSLALVNLYNTMGGSSWVDQSNWLTGPISTWYGITVSPNKKITAIDLRDNNLQGALPSGISDLKALTSLLLNNNHITALPSSIGLLSELITLSVEQNDLSSIPNEITQLTQLTELNLNKNQLSSLPSNIAALSQLVYLSISSNLFTTMPSGIIDLPHLTFLNITNNHMTAIPSGFGAVFNRSAHVILDGNDFTDLPDEVWTSMTDVLLLQISNGKFKTVSPLIANMHNLQTLYLTSSQVETLPQEICSLTQLETIYLSLSKVTTLPDLHCLSSLSMLNVDRNYLSYSEILKNNRDSDPLFSYNYFEQYPSIDTPTVVAVQGQPLTLQSTYLNAGNNARVQQSCDYSYQWYKDEVLIDGAVQFQYTIPSFSPSDEGHYSCNVRCDLLNNITGIKEYWNVTLQTVTATTESQSTDWGLSMEYGRYTVMIPSYALSNDLQVLVYDLQGKVMQVYGFNQTVGNQLPLQTEHYTNGLFLVKCVSGKSSYSSKIILTR